MRELFGYKTLDTKEVDTKEAHYSLSEKPYQKRA